MYCSDRGPRPKLKHAKTAFYAFEETIVDIRRRWFSGMVRKSVRRPKVEALGFQAIA